MGEEQEFKSKTSQVQVQIVLSLRGWPQAGDLTSLRKLVASRAATPYMKWSSRMAAPNKFSATVKSVGGGEDSGLPSISITPRVNCGRQRWRLSKSCTRAQPKQIPNPQIAFLWPRTASPESCLYLPLPPQPWFPLWKQLRLSLWYLKTKAAVMCPK